MVTMSRKPPPRASALWWCWTRAYRPACCKFGSLLIGLFVWRPGLVPLEGLPLNIAQNTLRPLFRIGGLSTVQLAASSWPEEFAQRYEAHGLALLHTNEADWVQRTNEYGLRHPTHACQIFVYRAFDLWSQMGPMYRATVSVIQFMIPDEILWRIAVYWPDLGNHWHEASWRLYPVDDSRSASCLPDLIRTTYVLVMPGLLNEMAHRPHGLLEVTQGDLCHVRATVLPPRINLPILQEFLKAFCRRGN